MNFIKLNSVRPSHCQKNNLSVFKNKIYMSASTSSAPSAAELFATVSEWIKTGGLNQDLLPRSKNRRQQHPFVSVVDSISEIPKGKFISEPDARAGLRAFFISMPDDIITTLPNDIVQGIEAILASELADSDVTDAEDLIKEFVDEAHDANNEYPYPVAVWRGDMSKLKCGAMVNPANGDLLGCFLPSHKCLDNILHAQAGPRLRVECKKLKMQQGIDWDQNGQCRVTGAEMLPAKYVFHTVGPDLNEGRGYDKFVRKPTATDRKELASCYETCIKTASELKCPSVAFCCISTGVFGYPSEEAVSIAMNTTKEQLDELAKKNQFIPKIIFNTFLEKDFNLYMDSYENVFANAKFTTGNTLLLTDDESVKEKEEEVKVTTEQVVEEAKSTEEQNNNKKNDDDDDDDDDVKKGAAVQE